VPLERRHARIPAAIALVALAAFFVLWLAVRTELVRDRVANAVAGATGLPASIESLRLGFLPSPSLVIGGLALDQPPGFGAEPFASVGRLEIRVPWSGIFGIDELRSVAASDATVRLVVDRDGAANWTRLGGDEAAPSVAAAPEAARWSIGSLRLERGNVDYRDLASGTQVQLAAIALEAGHVAPAEAFPFDLKLGGFAGGQTIHFAMRGEGRFDPAAGAYEGRALDFRGWLGGDPLPLAGAELTGWLGRASWDQATGVAILQDGRFEFAEIPGRFEGRLEFGGPSVEAVVSVTTDAFAPRAPAIILGHPLPTTADPAALESLQLALEARLEGGVLRIDPVSGRLDDTNFEGRAVPAERLVRATLDRIDLDRYLPRAANVPGSPTAAQAASTKQATLEATVAELAKLDIDAEIRVAEARAAGAVLQDAVIRVERSAEAAP
jgi:AsmA protein